MPATRLVFVDVDTQRDFLEPSGSLFIPGSERIRKNLARLTEAALRLHIPILATACAHTPDEVDPEPFPPHCLVGTEGQRRIVETEHGQTTVLSTDNRLAGSSALPHHLTLEKTRYDIFSRVDAHEVFNHYGGDSTRFVVYGVATDYCVRAAVLGLRARGHEVEIPIDAVWAIDVEAESRQFADFIAAGAVLTTTDRVLMTAERLASA